MINVRFPSEDGFMMKVCDLNQKEDNNSNGRKEVRFSRKVSKVPNESGVYSTKEPCRDEESSL